MPVQAIVHQDWSKGSNLVTNPYDIGKEQNTLVTNFILDEHGSLHVRDGTLLQTTSPDVAPNIRPIIKLFDFIRQDGVIFKLAIIKGTTTNNQLYNRGTTPWTLIGTLGTKYELPDILAFTNLALIADGYEIPWSYDGVTLRHLEDTPGTGSLVQGANHHTLHQGYYWVWNTAAQSGVGTALVAAKLTTALGVANADATYIAITPGVGGNAITIEYKNNGASLPLVVSVVATAITVQLHTNGGGTPISTLNEVLAAVNGLAAANALVSVSPATGNTGAGVPPVLAATNLAGGAAGAANIYDGPSSLRSSDINNPNSWPKANQIFVDKDDGDQGMGMGQFTIAESGISPSTSQILFKAFSAYQMTGVFGSTNPVFAIQRIKSDMGCVAPRTIRFAPGFGLIRLTHRGVALFNGVDDHLISEEIRPLIFGSDTFQGIDWTRVATCRAEVISNPPLYVLFCPMLNAGGGTTAGLTRCFCYDLVRKSWTILYYATSVSTVQSIEDPNVLPQTLIGDFAEGGVRTIFNPVAQAQGNDDGVPISWSAILRPVSSPSPQQRGFFRRAILKVTDAEANFHVLWQVLLGPVGPFGQTVKQGIITIPWVTPSVVGYPPGWGFSAWGLQPYGDPIGNATQVPGSETDCNIDIKLIADNARMLLTGQGHCILRGIEWHVAPKPLVRPSIYV